LLADLAGVERVVISALALLFARERGHGANFQQVSIFQAGQALADPIRFGLTAPGGILGGGLPGYNLYPARSGWIAIATLEGHFQKKLIQVLGLENDDSLDTIFREKTAGEWAAWAEENDLPLVEVNNISKSPIKEEDQ
jgi:alpha-methylacyl-CoA racemase